ncbi:hypothetical protein ULMS_02300 [Patiriisocius marinistellae]|uniref:Uncharacterized protein n=1 Tax=Patiriisocius marinistellae TaxID=2494560 RepID=A0A5J4FUN3_9FLAO|nr:hypothetical protein ULMS_02300 [Patiriisocius marinistellae]
MTPLAEAIVEGMHKFSHAVSKSTAHHHHGNHHNAHGHEHETISFIAELFSDKQQNNNNDKIPSVKIDKHFSEISYSLKTPERIFRTHNFNYEFNEVTFPKSLDAPPPEV